MQWMVAGTQGTKDFLAVSTAPITHFKADVGDVIFITA